ncbi:hypothetical protein FS837_006627 [Tulasnella sp. UAMH 9824]|nr:hypothetical protein FS837_006627 [Tulasnella sp. UAMH 9824]
MEAISTHSKHKSQAHKALLIPEILALVLSYLDPESLALTARVSRLWNSAAEDHLWHDLNGIAKLFRVFGPLVAGNWPGLELVPDGSGNPRRFLDLAKKVRSLNQAMRADTITVNSFNTVKSHFDTEIDCLFPGLRHFQWTTETGTERLNPQVFAFLCPTSIRTIKLTVQTWDGIKHESCINMFRTIGGVLFSSLTEFEVNFFPERYECDARGGNEIVGVISQWKNLSSLSLKEIYMAPTQVELLLRGQLPLQQLTLSVLDPPGPSLSHVSDVLAQHCSSLRRLHLYMDETERDPIEFRHLAHLLACRSLTELQIFHSCAIYIDADAVHRMGANWRDMEILNLVTTVDAIISRIPTPCCRLLDFAAAMPKLEKLGIFFSYTEIPIALEHLSHTFQRLRVLGVGPARVRRTEVPGLGQFLRAICPPGAKIACSYDSWAEPVFDTDWNWTRSRACWVEVQQMMDSGR